MDRLLWREKYPEDSYPAFPCPKCRNGLLKRVKNRTVTIWEPSDEPLIASGKFTSFFACPFGFCKTIAVMSGRASSGPYYYPDQDGEEQMGEETNFYPLSMMPGPRVIAIHQKTPKAVREQIEKSFNLLWTDAGSCINKLRISVEEIVAHAGIARETPEGRFIPLHNRLVDWEKRGFGHHDTMLALKDIGNDGSHEVGLTLADCIDAFDILETALEDIYGGRKARQDAIKAKFTKPRRGSTPPD
ncbi:DUF4145 domain-containing protein [Mesorhizobium sp. M1227]|uniref:DUF4145 domain-containing protein n=1 Tax=Mesorhizobium sp. M1227 TaxID=2957071 RepID=UPI00333A2F4F